MRTVLALFLLMLICPATTSFAVDAAADFDRAAPFYQLLDNAIAANLISGGVVAIGNSDGILLTADRGVLDDQPTSALLNDSTIFDLASLTKVVATTPAVMKLVDDGQISLKDPIRRWFPEFRGRKRGITVLNLLTHTSGLKDVQVKEDQSIGSVIRRAAAERHRPWPGRCFKYADINFIILGELVRRVSGSRLDAFCHENLYEPLGARETMFRPPPELDDHIAPTMGAKSGTVQDINARRLGGVAGHAGLFSSLSDLSRFARMLLGRGVLDGTRVLSEQAVIRMTTPYLCGRRGFIRTPGWDMKSPYSAPKGTFFSGTSFGHTGYSGTSIWIDPEQNLFVILLTNRLDYKDTGRFNRLRRDISTSAAEEFAPHGEMMADTPPLRAARINSLRAGLVPRHFEGAKKAAKWHGRHLRMVASR
jgi:CubicO group peptidase (beta-lactamase class C family)